MDDVTRYAFKIDRYDELAGVVNPYQLLVYAHPNEKRLQLEINDLKRNRRFLSRAPYVGIALSDLRIGARITMLVRVCGLVLSSM